VVRRLAAAEPEASHPDRSAWQETVTGLEYELATAWTKHGKLAEENVRLREQLRAAQRSLALAAERVRRLPVSTDLDRSEVVLLQRLLVSASADDPRTDNPPMDDPRTDNPRMDDPRTDNRGTGDADREAQGLDHARSVLS
jgi:hypothetical protein